MSYATLEKKSRKNAIKHVSQELNIERTVVFSGYTLIPNLLTYSDRASVANQQSILKDVNCDLDIVYAEVIRFYNADHAPYNGMIAYIIKSRNGRWYMKYQIPNLLKKIVVPISMTEKMLPSSRNFQLSAGVLSSGEGSIPFVLASSAQTDVDSHIRSLPGNFIENSEMHYFWSTVLLEPQLPTWNQSARNLNIADLHCHYQVLETQEFD